MIAYRPVGAAAINANVQSRPFSLAQKVRPLHTPPKTLGETFDEMLGFSPMLGDLLRLAGHGLGSWVGVYAGIYGKSSWMRAVGWVIGVGQGLTGVCDVVSIIQRLVHPTLSTPSQATPEIQGSGRANWGLVK